MSEQLQFVSWARRGVGAATTAEIHGIHRSVTLSLDVTADVPGQQTRTAKDVKSTPLTVLGPADIQPRSEDFGIVRRSPHRSDHPIEPNLLACIEFAHPDVPWLFSPKEAAPEQLTPWIMLVVVRMTPEQETNTLKARPNTPYQILRIDSAESVPNPSDAWAFAHVQVVADDPAGALSAVKDNPGSPMVRSRILCPTRLDPESRYFAALVPTFEAGRLVGIGQDSDADGLWTPTAGVELPVYDGWFFTTGPVGDFELLARKLGPLPTEQYAQLGIGIRRVAVGPRGALMQREEDAAVRFEPAVHEIPTAIARTAKAGSLAPPGEPPEAAAPAAPEAIALHERLKELVNIVAGATDTDPIVGPPLYGQWPAETPSIDGQPATAALQPLPAGSRQTWIEELNADPYLRIAAGLGAQLIQQDQEEYMAEAWNQLADLVTANLRIRWATLMSASMTAVHTKLVGAAPALALRTVAPALARVLDTDGTATVRARLDDTTLPREAIGAALSRTARYVTRATRFAETPQTITSAVTKVADALVTSALTALPARFGTPAGIDQAQLGELLSRPELADKIRADGGVDPGQYLRQITAVPDTMKVLATKITEVAGPLVEDHQPQVQVQLNEQINEQARRLADVLDRDGIAQRRVTPRILNEVNQLRIAPVRTMSADAIATLNAAALQTPAVDIGGVQARLAPLAIDDAVTQISLSPRLLGGAGSLIAAAGGGVRELGVGAAEGLKVTALAGLGMRAPLADDIVGTLGEADATLVKQAVTQIGADFVAPTGKPATPALQQFSYATAGQMLAALKPDSAYSRMLSYAHTFAPASGVVRRPDWEFHPAMAAPQLHTPLVTRLTTLDQEWVLGGVGKLPNNTICLLELNRRFVEALLVGANHEFARELLWRRYPTDLRGTCFHRFWDAPPTLSIADLTTWQGLLGTHSGVGKNLTVLVIKGDLLRRYPNTLVSAEKGTTSNVQGDTDFRSDGEVASELFRGFIGADVTYSVLDIDPQTLRQRADNDPHSLHCWYISLLEPYDELRFGLDDEDRGPNKALVRGANGLLDYSAADDWTWQGLDYTHPPHIPKHITVDRLFAANSSAIAGASLLQRPFRLLLRAPDYMPEEN